MGVACVVQLVQLIPVILRPPISISFFSFFQSACSYQITITNPLHTAPLCVVITKTQLITYGTNVHDEIGWYHTNKNKERKGWESQSEYSTLAAL